MYVKNNLATATNYTDAATLECPDAVRVNITTTVKQVTCSMRIRSGAVKGLTGKSIPWGPDVELGRSQRSLDRNIDGIRFKSTVAGEVATVNVEAMTADEAN